LPIIVSDLSYGKQQIKTVKIILHRKLCRQDFCCLGTENLRKLTKTMESALDFYIIEPNKINLYRSVCKKGGGEKKLYS